MATKNTAPAAKVPDCRCAGCGEYTAPERHMLCEDCTDSRPDEDEPTDVGYEGGCFR
jgi:hypothetical protein